MQLGIPIKQMKTSALRKAGVGAYSLLDTALLGLLPNSILQPANKTEEAIAGVGQIGGLLAPFGLPMKIGRGLMGGARAAGWMKPGTGAGGKFFKGFGEGFGKGGGWNPFGRGGKTPVGGGGKGVDTGKMHGPFQALPQNIKRGPIVDKTPIPKSGGRGVDTGVMHGPFMALPPGTPRQQALGSAQKLIGPGRGNPRLLGANRGPFNTPSPQVVIENTKQILGGASRSQLQEVARRMGIKSGGSNKALKDRILAAVQKVVKQQA